ncbi:MAG: transcriptional regulator FlhC [Polaromonas sp. 39-63-203]|jgi:flagellar transcriptional activator FlhC|uniref:flagellar transcriptional regulator FlhC n=1 Tax=Polaromonas sp. TaxID=1869339 RepID=UPI000BD4633D|nr:flagellar transcriptional regulator FlhC [Polaromonas sp.]OYY53010.1 MAG: transcriptional regulator FlhC [Polaromonas sp. 35-63-240]OYY99302.1 MAG: transcriptional regulator FlhC [Polaromonas sp. 28-63-22]OYZ84168.1 MAG: transcriptional regulator FlhC [Polaromonas sp. 24-62-144]OZA99119.1 MAG: transcriptional regulator FlhC [Polaromonas sp. 39-63-203]HQS31604.1 flagellar transcriptional regulator FlhC [Polaromonas sp.]
MTGKSVLREAREIHLAIDLIKLGARLQFLEAETSLSRDRLIKLYKEIRGVSPPKGLLPFSTDWFMTWMSNIHSSMFYNIYRFMVTHGGCTRIEALIKSYRLYREQVKRQGSEVVLDFTRAWTLVRFFDSDMLQLSTCTRCTGQFVAHAHDPQSNYVCVLCRPPSRAGKLRKIKADVALGVDAIAVPGALESRHPAVSSSQWLANVMIGAHV